MFVFCGTLGSLFGLVDAILRRGFWVEGMSG